MYCESFDKLSDDEFISYLQTIAYEVRRKRGVLEIQIGAISQASKRVLNITPHLEQLIGVYCIVFGHIIQMQTGEGKTLTAALSAIYKGWQNRNCHIVTSNDYLAQRDATKMEPLFSYCNLSVDYIISTIEPQLRKQCYENDIVYSTSKELLADYLRDRICGIFDKYPTQKLLETYQNKGNNKQVMRGLNTAIIDEADSVLADEATIPLIIASGEENQDLEEALRVIFNISQSFIEGVDYNVDKLHKEILMTDKGFEQFELQKFNIPDVWASEVRRNYLLQQTLIAKHFYLKNIQYGIDDGKIVIIDEKTGRLMHGRSWGGALHQAIEVKENLNITQMTQTHKKMSFQFFFRLYKELSGMSGTLHSLGFELWSIYELLVIKIQTHKPNRMKIYPEIFCATKKDKWNNTIQNAILEASKGRAVLIGTRSIVESQLLYELISIQYDNVVLLNALYQNLEAEIIAKAGSGYKITIATNIAGRGTDIHLSEEVISVGGLHVIATERHESRRVDIQLYGRTARQGEVGSVQSIISLEDDLFIHYMPKVLHNFLKLIHSFWFGKKLGRYFYIILQKIVERKISTKRHEALLHDIKLFKMLSFAK
jgi:preprotein translocase subunit SecA